jgi:hypothetical protein
MTRISQVLSSTPFLCCSRFSPIAFNLSNTKPSIQLLFILTVPFGVSNQRDHIQRDRPYILKAQMLKLDSLPHLHVLLPLARSANADWHALVRWHLLRLFFVVLDLVL